MKQSGFLQSRLTFAAVGLLLIFFVAANITCDQKQAQTQADDPLSFPKNPTAIVPADVDVKLKESLEKEKKFADVQRLFDLVAWKAFVAVNWPTDDAGKPKSKLSDAGLPVWSWFKESFEVYKPDGSEPGQWGGNRELNAEVPGHEGLAADAIQKTNRVLFRNNKHREIADIADESDQAFGGGLWDQNGNLVMYEVLMNKTEFNYVVKNKLYTKNGQIEFSQNGGKVVFPTGVYGTDSVGALELKIAWKVIDPDNDIASRYLMIDGYVPDPNQPGVSIDSNCVVTFPDKPVYKKVKLGMVGMHIALKTVSSPQWIWGTFEHVDNIAADGTVTGKSLSGKTVNLSPSFYDPDCIECLPNGCPTVGSDGKRRSQLIRMIPIPGDKRILNRQASQVLAGLGSVLQFYELIDTQWPTQPSSPPDPPGNGIVSVRNKAGGQVTPTFLTNMTMETYFQQGVQTAWSQEESYGKPPKPTPADLVKIWATESCTGCHYSAPVAIDVTMTNGKTDIIYGPPQSADFSWLLKTQAKYIQKQ